MSVPREELQSRWKKIQHEMEEDAILIPLGVNFYYLFGKQGLPTERIIAGILPRDTDPFLISPAFEESNL